MSKLKSKAQLQELAKPIFEKNKKLEYVFATGDGNVFLPESENAAKLHGNEKGLKVYELQRPSAEDAPAKKTVDERIDSVETMDSIQEIQEAIKDERSSKVKSAGQARIKSIMDAEAATKSETDAKARATEIKAAKKSVAEKAKAAEANKEIGTQNS